MVDGALRQLYRTLNGIHIELNGWPGSIVVEMSRELGQGITRRNEIQAQQSKNQLSRKNAKVRLEENGCTASERNIKCYLLAEEQDFKCPYSKAKAP